MIKYHYKNIKDKSPQALKSFRAGCWIDVQDPTEKELRYLAKNFSLEHGHLRDAMDIHEVPRLESENDTVYIFTRFPHNDGEQITTSPVLIVVNKTFVATISPKTPFFIERFLGKKDYVTTDKVALFLQIISEINTSYNYFFNQISKQIRSLEINVEKISNRDIIQFVAFEGIFNDFRPSLIHINSVLEALLKGKKLLFYEKDSDLVEDIVLSNKQLVEMAEDSQGTITNIREAYTTIMTNNLNRVIKLFTTLTVLLTVPSVTLGIYSMNVPLPFQHEPWTFWVINIITAFICVAMLWVFIKKDFL